MARIEWDDEIRRVAISILTYFQRHPRAQDSIPGIAQWWVHENVKNVNRALELLIREGVVERKGRLYRLKETFDQSVEQSDSL